MVSVKTFEMLWIEKDSAASPADELASCSWALAERLPSVINFGENPLWRKRTDGLRFARFHALLFVSPDHAEVTRAMRAAARRFARGTLLVLKFVVSATETDPIRREATGDEHPIPTRYGVHTVHDTPKLVFLDQRTGAGQDPQRVFDRGQITEQAVIDFLAWHGVPERVPL